MHIQSEENSVTEAKSKVDEAQPVIIESKEEIKKEDKEEVKENIKEDVENHEPVQDEKTLLEKQNATLLMIKAMTLKQQRAVI